MTSEVLRCSPQGRVLALVGQGALYQSPPPERQLSQLKPADRPATALLAREQLGSWASYFQQRHVTLQENGLRGVDCVLGAVLPSSSPHMGRQCFQNSLLLTCAQNTGPMHPARLL